MSSELIGRGPQFLGTPDAGCLVADDSLGCIEKRVPGRVVLLISSVHDD